MKFRNSSGTIQELRQNSGKHLENLGGMTRQILSAGGKTVARKTSFRNSTNSGTNLALVENSGTIQK